MSDSIVNLLLALFGGGTLVGVLNLLANRRKVGAETQGTLAAAGDTLVGAAGDVVTMLRAELDRQKDELGHAWRRIDGLEHREREQRRVLQVHAAWDYTALQALRQHGVDLPDAPPLFPQH